jgi:hypothetical protein
MIGVGPAEISFLMLFIIGLFGPVIAGAYLAAKLNGRR